MKFRYLVILIFLTTGCHREVVEVGQTGQVKDGKYDSEFPAQPVSAPLKKILKSVHLLSVLAFYRSYYFTKQEAVTAGQFKGNKIDLEKRKNIVFEQPASGTATLIYNDQRRIAFLTCAHIVNFPDTVITYYEDRIRSEQPLVKHFITKVRQTGNIINQPVAFDFRILAIDEETDVAVVGKEIEPGDLAGFKADPDDPEGDPIRILTLKQGAAQELDWANFVYIIGFPRAKKMVSSALVSSPDYDFMHSFLLDGAMQKGISGGIVIALRDGVPNFELVGMAVGISGKVQYALVPELQKYVNEWEIQGPYYGQIHVEKQEIPEPGMIYVRSIEAIRSFLDEKKDILQEQGYDPARFFK